MQKLKSIWHTHISVCALALLVLFPLFSPSHKPSFVEAQEYIGGTAGAGTYTGLGQVGQPGARRGGASVTDKDGNLWLYGGLGSTTNTGTTGQLNDLWKFNITTRQWTWINGTSSTQAGNYPGSTGSGQSGTPGPRNQHAFWVDSTGVFYMFGGNGYTTDTINQGPMNDFWKYEPNLQRWTWLRGSNSLWSAGSYNGVNNAGYPGSKQAMGYCTNLAGTKLYLFGGSGFTSVAGSAGNTPPVLSDLWEYDIATTQWKLLAGGSDTNGVATYTGVSQKPGARNGIPLWADNNNRLWLFGGFGNNNTATQGPLSDLWMFDLSTSKWEYKGGQTFLYASAIYNSIGDAGEPGARTFPNYWTDASYKLWMYGGGYTDSSNNPIRKGDFWTYDTTTSTWSWVGGSSLSNTNNNPPSQFGSRQLSSTWLDKEGKVWIFGGYGSALNNYNDLWAFMAITSEKSKFNITLTANSPTTVTLTWSAVLTYNYILQKSTDGVNWAQEYYGSSYVRTVEDLTPVSFYYFKVCATNVPGICATNYTDPLLVSTSATITTIAGLPSSPTAGTADGTGDVARFTSPRGLIIDSQHNFILLDRVSTTVTNLRFITPKGQVSTNKTFASSFVGIAKASTGYYIADNTAGAGSISLYDNNFANPTTVTSGTTSVDGTPGSTLVPYSLWLDEAANFLYFTESGGTFRRVHTGTRATTTLILNMGGTARQITRTASGTFYIGTNGGAVYTYNGATGSIFAGSSTTGFADGAVNVAKYTAASGLAVDVNNNLFVIDRTTNSKLRRTTSAGVTTNFMNLVGFGNEIYKDPTWDGVMYVLELYALRMVYYVKPQEPANTLNIVPGATNVSATWRAPTMWPTAAITKYYIALIMGGNTAYNVTVDPTVFTATIIDIASGHYTLSLYVRNEYGDSAAVTAEFDIAGDCSSTCNGHGSCNVSNICVCTGNFDGATCNQCKNGFEMPTCTGCANGYVGPNCVACDPQVNCGGHGACNATGGCDCTSNYAGPNCASCATDQYGPSCATHCEPTACGVGAGRATGCNQTSGACVCQPGFNGTTCNTCAEGHYNWPECKFCDATLTCNGTGTCNTNNGTCKCNNEFSGDHCGECAANYFGWPNCKYCSASDNCQAGQGTCNTTSGNCECNPGFIHDALSNTCQSCPAGSIGTAGSCTQCPAGTYQNGTKCDTCPSGQTSSSAGATSCTNCVAGTYAKNSTTCVSCASGSVSTSGSSSCSVCPAGTYASTSTCAPCASGTVSTNNGSVSCTKCLDGFVPQNSSTVCGRCDPGTVAVGGSASCTVCQPGQFPQNSTTCGACPLGQIASAPGTAQCTPCAAGSYAINSTNCVQCDSGSVAGVGSRECTKCAPGTHKNNATSCVTCESGKTSGLGSAQCDACPAGTYATNSTNCLACPSGTTSQAGVNACSECPTGERAVNSTNCEKCAAGTYAVNRTCVACPSGTTSAVGSTSCSQCGAGEYAVTPTTCAKCAAGTYATNSTCVTCPSGTTSQEGSTSCSQCGAGEHAVNSTTCAKCAAGTYATNSTCVTCPSGTTSQEGSTSCSQCGAGEYAVNSTACAKCAAGTYAANSTCVACAPGSTSGEGSSNCTQCSPGSITTDALTCVSCDAGSYAPNGTTCLTCAPGSTSPQSGSATCTQCVAGTYAKNSTTCLPCENGDVSAPGSTSCNSCGAGFYSVNTTCVPCAEGTTSVPGSSQCNACPDGQVAVNSTTCVTCDAGTHKANATACAACEFGSVAAAGSNECTKCAPGEFIADPATCTPCDAGSYESSHACVHCDAGSVSDTNSTQCTACVPGEYAFNSTTCVVCDAGSHAPNNTVCLPCDSNSVAQAGSTSCTPCPTGHFPNTTTQTCTHCDAGFYYNGVKCLQCGFGSVAQPASLQCTPCAAGQYAINASTCVPCAPGSVSTPESIECIVCDAGSISSLDGTNCIACDAGSIAATHGLTECTICEAGSYAINSTACEKCAPGSVSFPGSSQCHDCNPGTYAFNTTTCVACTPGYVAPNPAALQCTPCDAGTFARNTTTCSNCPAVHVSRPGSTRCTPCGAGLYVFNASTCAASCGDGFCDKDGDEDCMNCPQDCTAPCQKCGDGICEAAAGETCRNCIQDCRVCEPPKCPQSNGQDCSGNGRCAIPGICTCNSGFTGPLCDQKNVPIQVVVNTTKPAVVVRPPAPSTTGGSTTSGEPAQAPVSFSVNVKQLNEVNNAGVLQGDSYDLTNKTFEYEELSNEYSTTWKYYTTLDNSAQIIVSLIFFNATKTIDFAGQLQILQPDELKMTVEVKLWPFKSLRNSLDIILEAVVVSEQTQSSCASTAADDNGILRWFKINVNELQFYGQFLPLALVDDKARPLGIAYTESSSRGLVTVHSPVFYDNLIVDPNFSVLFGKNGAGDVGGSGGSGDPCGQLAAQTKGDEGFFTTTNIIAIAVSVGGAACIGVAGALWATNQKRKRRGSIMVKNGKAKAVRSESVSAGNQT